MKVPILPVRCGGLNKTPSWQEGNEGFRPLPAGKSPGSPLKRIQGLFLLIYNKPSKIIAGHPLRKGLYQSMNRGKNGFDHSSILAMGRVFIICLRIVAWQARRYPLVHSFFNLLHSFSVGEEIHSLPSMTLTLHFPQVPFLHL